MLIGIGNAHSKTLELLRLRFATYQNVYVYPEFFDAKLKLVLERNYVTYIMQLYRNRDSIVLAVYPDWYHKLYVAKLVDCVWIYPLHSLDEIDFVLRLSDVAEVMLGFPSSDRIDNIVLRDYTLQQFIDVAKMYGFRTWWLGANKTELRKAMRYNFDGVDITERTCNMFVDARPWHSIRFVKCVEKIVSTLSNNLLKFI